MRHAFASVIGFLKSFVSLLFVDLISPIFSENFIFYKTFSSEKCTEKRYLLMFEPQVNVSETAAIDYQCEIHSNVGHSCSFTLLQSSKNCIHEKSELECSDSFILNLSSKGMLMSLMRSKLKPKGVGFSKYCLYLRCMCFEFVELIVALFPPIFAPQYDVMSIYCCTPLCYFFIYLVLITTCWLFSSLMFSLSPF